MSSSTPLILEHRDDAAERVFPDFALGLHVAAEAAKFGDRRGFAGAHLDATIRYKIECGNAFGDALRRVGGQLHDAVAEPDVLRPLAGGTEKDFGRRRVGVLLEKVVLDLPGVVVAKPVGELHLIERVLIELSLIIRSPRTRKLQFVEDAEFHGLFPDLLAGIPPEPDQGVKGSAVCTGDVRLGHKDRHFHIRMTNFFVIRTLWYAIELRWQTAARPIDRERPVALGVFGYGKNNQQQHFRSRQPGEPLVITRKGAVISSGTGVDGIDGTAAAVWTITNSGKILSAGGIGISLAGAGTVTNGPLRADNALISGSAGGVAINGAGTVANTGLISSSYGFGVELRSGGAVTNTGATSAILGGFSGVEIAGASGTVPMKARSPVRSTASIYSQAAASRTVASGPPYRAEPMASTSRAPPAR